MPFVDQPFGDRLPERLGSGHVSAASRSRERRLERRLGARRRRERLPAHVVDDLRVDMRHAAEHAQPRPLRRARNALALPERDACAAILRGVDLHIKAIQFPVSSLPALPRHKLGAGELESWKLFRARLSGLLLQHFAGVADALLLVGIRLAQTSNVRRHLSDRLAIDAGHRDVRLLVDRDVDSRQECRTPPGASSRARTPPASLRTSARYPTPTMSRSLRNPSVTPRTALATRLRASPWNLPSSASSRSVRACS